MCCCDAAVAAAHCTQLENAEMSHRLLMMALRCQKVVIDFTDDFTVTFIVLLNRWKMFQHKFYTITWKNS
jgi:hypothetical protein